MILKTILTTALLSSIALADCCNDSPEKKISIENPIARPAQKGRNTGVYMTVKLDCKKATDTLLSAECDAATSTELHDHINDNGIMRMRPVKDVLVKDGEVTFKPGSLHVMLMGLKYDLKEGETLKIRLNFKKAGTMDIDYTVKTPA